MASLQVATSRGTEIRIEMMNACMQCGSYNADKFIVPADDKGQSSFAYAICPECGYKQIFRHLPLFIVCGASGTGKTAACTYLATNIQKFIPLDGDILWCPVFNQPEDNYTTFYELWLRVAKNISQAGRPVVLFNAGGGVPANISNTIEQRYFSAIHILALTCEGEILKQRLQERPSWRDCNETFILTQLAFNQWYISVRPSLIPPVTILDTSHNTVQQTAKSIIAWVDKHFPAPC